MPIVATATPTASPPERAPAAKPVVTKLKPASGPASGGTKVVVKGTNLTGATKVVFGKAKGTKLKVKSPRKLTVVSPAGKAGKVKLKVTTPKGTSKGVTFTYVPTVTGLRPSSGLSSGGARVTVTGSGFAAGATVTFGGVPGSGVTILSKTSLAVTTPPHAAGAVPVVVKVAKQTSAPRTFTYLAAPTLTLTPIPGVDQSLPSTTEDVACTAPGACAAVGSYGGGPSSRPMIVTLGSGSWTAADVTLPGDAHVSPSATLTDISCPTTTFCAAVGHYRTTGPDYAGLATTWNGASWSTAVAIPLPADITDNDQPLLRDLDCGAATDCRAVGYYNSTSAALPLLVSWVASSWTASSPSLPVGATGGVLSRIDCAAAGECMAVGFANESGGGSAAYVEAIVGGVASAVVPALPLDAVAGASGSSGLDAVDCTAVGVCVAVGNYLGTGGTRLLVARLASATWTTSATELPGDADPSGPYPYAGGLACPVTGQCAVAAAYRTTPSQLDQQGLMGTTSGDGQSFARMALPPGASTADPWIRPGEVVCAAAGRCVNVGAFAISPSSGQAHVVRMSGGAWLAPEPLALPTLASIATLLDTVSDSSNTAVAVGQATVSGQPHGLLATGIPLGP